jgi:hypothetical protein
LEKEEMMKLVILFSFMLSISSYAGLFKVINRTGTCVLACDTLEAEVNTNLPDADQSNYLKGMANAGVMSQRGLGADYASDIEYMSVSFAAGVGADVGSNSTSDLISGDADFDKVRGIGAGSAVSLSLNGGLFGSKLAGLDSKRMNFTAYFLSVNPPDKDGLSGKTTSLGFNLQYKIIPARQAALGILHWGGVSFTTGLERASTELRFVEAISQSITDTGVTASFNGTATVGAEVTTYNIPFELSSSIRLFHVLSLFSGLGMDLSYGKAKSIANLTGNVTVTGGGAGDASLDLGTEDSPSTFAFRGFIGTQVNLTAIKVFALVNRGFGNDRVGLTIGARLAF